MFSDNQVFHSAFQSSSEDRRRSRVTASVTQSVCVTRHSISLSVCHRQHLMQNYWLLMRHISVQKQESVCRSSFLISPYHVILTWTASQWTLKQSVQHTFYFDFVTCISLLFWLWLFSVYLFHPVSEIKTYLKHDFFQPTRKCSSSFN